MARHDAVVPLRSFQDDLARKLRLRQVMGKHEAAPEDHGLEPGEQREKDDVNYRYSGDPDRACAVCVHFQAPDACEVVAGMIRSTDLCDLFEAARDRGPGREDVFDDDFGDGGDYTDAGGDCPDGEKDLDGRCPGDADYDELTAGLYEPRVTRATLDEVTPPGYEPVVRALKRRPGVEEPYAVAWSMYKRGARPKATEAVEHVLGPGGKWVPGPGEGGPMKLKKPEPTKDIGWRRRTWTPEPMTAQQWGAAKAKRPVTERRVVRATLAEQGTPTAGMVAPPSMATPPVTTF